MAAGERRADLRAVATVGNAVALLLVVLVLLNADVLFRRALPAPAAEPPSPGVEEMTASPVRPLLLVLCDGLRADVTENPGLMPQLYGLEARGSRAVARVEALIPSTIAGVRAVVEGVVVAPANFVFDFASPAAPGGGFLEATKRRGGHTFVAAPRLWRDLYGPWIDEAVTTNAVDGEDQRLLEATLEHLQRPGWSLAIVHFSRPDVAAHLAGGTSVRYQMAAAWCDRAIGQLVAAMGPAATIVVTSDHGVTDGGGHAGLEANVRFIPVVAAGPGAIRLPPSMRQAELAAYLSDVLQKVPKSPKVTRASHGAGQGWRSGGIMLALLATWATWRILGSALALAGTLHSQAAFWLHAGVLVTGTLAVMVPGGGMLAAALWLVVVAWRMGPTRWASLGWSAAALWVGCFLGKWRLAYVESPAGSFPVNVIERLTPALLLALGVSVLVWPRGRRSGADLAPWAFCWGAMAVVLAAVGNEWSGETVSLSTLDVRGALALATTSLGWPGAAVVAAVRPFLPVLALLLPTIPAWAKRGPGLLGPLAAGVGAVLAGEGLVAAGRLCLGVRAEGDPETALALALMIRTVAETLLLFPLLAASAWLVLRKKAGAEVKEAGSVTFGS